ncbi:hypothetical protein EON71_00485 [bacterium]|nr:MAG: hypothetical protein EON71_00485 [bacterium]
MLVNTSNNTIFKKPQNNNINFYNYLLLRPGDYLIRESRQPGMITIQYVDELNVIYGMRLAFIKDKWEHVNDISVGSVYVNPFFITVDADISQHSDIFKALLSCIPKYIKNPVYFIKNERCLNYIRVF